MNEAKRLPWEPAPSDPDFWSVLLSHVMGASIRQLASAENMVREAMELAARASESSPPQPNETLQRIREILFSAMEMKESSLETYDRSALELAMIASNAIFWRQREIDKLRGAAATAPSAPTATPEPKVADELESEAIDWLRENGFPPGQPMHFQIGERGAEGERFGYKYPCEVLAAFVRSRFAPTATDWMRRAAVLVVKMFANQKHAPDCKLCIDDAETLIQQAYAGEHAGAESTTPRCLNHGPNCYGNTAECKVAGAESKKEPTV